VTGFFGDSIRFRTNESVVDELLRLKARARQDEDRSAYSSLMTIWPLTLSARSLCYAPSSLQVHRYLGRANQRESAAR